MCGLIMFSTFLKPEICASCPFASSSWYYWNPPPVLHQCRFHCLCDLRLACRGQTQSGSSPTLSQLTDWQEKKKKGLEGIKLSQGMSTKMWSWFITETNSCQSVVGTVKCGKPACRRVWARGRYFYTFNIFKLLWPFFKTFTNLKLINYKFIIHQNNSLGRTSSVFKSLINLFIKQQTPSLYPQPQLPWIKNRSNVPLCCFQSQSEIFGPDRGCVAMRTVVSCEEHRFLCFSEQWSRCHRNLVYLS